MASSLVVNDFKHEGPQPNLLPFNRKLRTLCSVSLRNVNLPISIGRSRGRTIDDDADPKTFISPSKLRSLREEQTLNHSHSSSDLQHGLTSEDAAMLQVDGSPRHKSKLNGGSLRRPKRLRRRSTLEWTNAGAVQRQEKLEHVAEDKMVDVFFTFHVTGLQDPVYVSETIHRATDPTFRAIDLSHCDTSIQRQDQVLIRIWARSLKTQQWRMLSDTHVVFKSLHYLGKTFERIEHTTQQNAILLHFTDGIYGMPATTTTFLDTLATKQISSKQRRTTSFDALLRLAKLTDSIQDALSTRDVLIHSLDRLVENNRMALAERDQVEGIQDRLKTIEYAKTTVAKQIEKARRQIEEKQASLTRRRTLMVEDIKSRDDTSHQMHKGRAELPHLRDDREIRKKAIVAQRRRIVEDLDKIYNIRPLQDGRSLAFKIRDLPLPNADEVDSIPQTTSSAAFGYTAHTVLLLSFYLGIALPYTINPLGSTSWITDPISLINVASKQSVLSQATSSDKVYPLHLNRVARFRFDYGVFLLNKDIQMLLETGFGVRVIDIRHTLANLKYLMYVATSGEGDLPSRKAGGVRGLMTRGTLSRGSSSSSLSIWSGKEDQRDSHKAAQSLRNLVKGQS